MKSKSMVNTEVVDRFKNDELSKRKLNYLKGGDANGGQPGTDPWDPPG